MMVETSHTLVPEGAPVLRSTPEGLRIAELVPVSENSPGPRTFATALLVLPSGTAIPGDQAPRLTCDLFASMDWTNDGVIIRSELVDEEGYGRTYDAAWIDFLTSIRDRYISLLRRETRLSPEDRRVLNALRAAIDFGL